MPKALIYFLTALLGVNPVWQQWPGFQGFTTQALAASQILSENHYDYLIFTWVTAYALANLMVWGAFGAIQMLNDGRMSAWGWVPDHRGRRPESGADDKGAKAVQA
ncbi:hypothetical protein [Thiomonas sp.]